MEKVDPTGKAQVILEAVILPNALIIYLVHFTGLFLSTIGL